MRRMFDSRALRVVAAALIASTVGLIVSGAGGLLLLFVGLFVVMPHTELLWAFGTGLLLFGVAFVVSFREMLEKLSNR